MYKIALIDDEAIVREGMVELIPWKQIGLELIGTAEDGEEGLELIRNKMPDIILLDINMPKLNGLDLANIVKKLHPYMKIILISGYDEFDYARQALRMGVEDYILKPVTKSEMITLLNKVVGKLNEEREQSKKEVDVLNKIRQSIPLMQQKVLEELVFSDIEDKLIIKKCIKANIPYNKKCYGIFLINADQDINMSKDEKGKELTHFALQNIVNEVLMNKKWGILFEVDDLNAVMYFSDEDDQMQKHYQEAIAYIKNAITELMGITVTIGVGSLVNEVGEIHTAYDEAYHALMSSFFQGTGQIIYNIKPYQYKKVNFIKWVEWENEVIRSINNKEEFEKTITNICAEIRKSKMDIENIEEVWNNLAKTILKKFVEIDDTITGLFPDGVNIIEEITQCKTLLDMQRWINTLHGKCYQYINNQSNPNKVYITNIIAFIEENYNMPDLSMKMICEGVHISSSHFSSIFKKELGMTFVQYVTEYRIEKAKQFLRYTHLKTYEIAENIGYADSQYFSTIFKKYVHMSPLEYRRINGDKR